VAYETFERQSVSIEDPALTVAPIVDGRIALNASAARLLKKAGVTAVRILWDKTTCGLAVQAAEKGDENSYSVVFGRGGRQAAFSAKAFLRYIGWSCERRQTVRATWDEQKKMLEARIPSRYVRTRAQKATKQEAKTGE
jgi:hypothetical protein